MRKEKIILVLRMLNNQFKTNKMNCNKGIKVNDAINIDLMRKDLNDLKEKLKYKHSCKNYYNYFTQLNMTLGNALNVLIHKNNKKEKFT